MRTTVDHALIRGLVTALAAPSPLASATSPEARLRCGLQDDPPSRRRLDGRDAIFQHDVMRCVFERQSASAAGARPFNAISSKTPEPEQEPRLVGIIKMLPASETPCSGWWTSMTRLVAGSTPPQKLSASAAATTGPCATPERTLRTASKLPTVNGDFSTWLGRERHLSGVSRGKSTRTPPTLGRGGTFRRPSPRHPVRAIESCERPSVDHKRKGEVRRAARQRMDRRIGACRRRSPKLIAATSLFLVRTSLHRTRC